MTGSVIAPRFAARGLTDCHFLSRQNGRDLRQREAAPPPIADQILMRHPRRFSLFLNRSNELKMGDNRTTYAPKAKGRRRLNRPAHSVFRYSIRS
jgi:hypothetical protein